MEFSSREEQLAYEALDLIYKMKDLLKENPKDKRVQRIRHKVWERWHRRMDAYHKTIDFEIEPGLVEESLEVWRNNRSESD